jgi:diguanylate cyclase (GGDEF)-like protein
VARYGGEEFAVILPDTDLDGARLLAEAMRADVERLAMAHGASACGVVTLSIGAACRVPRRDGQGSTEFIKAADDALYQAKNAGRNRVEAEPETISLQ